MSEDTEIEHDIEEEAAGIYCPDCDSEMYELRWYIFGVRVATKLICSGCRKLPNEMDGDPEWYTHV